MQMRAALRPLQRGAAASPSTVDQRNGLPLWANFKDLALQYGLRACWSTPIHASDGKLLGTFANYYRFVRDPSPVDRELTEMITRTAAMAVEQDRHARLAVLA